MNILPAILTADIESAKKQMESVSSLTDYFHVDIADGKFVENTTFAVKDLVQLSQLGRFEVHLMVEDPQAYFEDCKAAQAQRVFFHMESTNDPGAVLRAMEEYPFERGVVLGSETPVSAIVPFKQDIDSVLIMSIKAGFQRQPFIKETLVKVGQVKEVVSDMPVGLDGGINGNTMALARQAGANYVVVGSGIFRQDDPATALTKLKAMIN